jgi:hypothetical protein
LIDGYVHVVSAERGTAVDGHSSPAAPSPNLRQPRLPVTAVPNTAHGSCNNTSRTQDNYQVVVVLGSGGTSQTKTQAQTQCNMNVGGGGLRGTQSRQSPFRPSLKVVATSRARTSSSSAADASAITSNAALASMRGPDRTFSNRTLLPVPRRLLSCGTNACEDPWLAWAPRPHRPEPNSTPVPHRMDTHAHL